MNKWFIRFSENFGEHSEHWETIYTDDIIEYMEDYLYSDDLSYDEDWHIEYDNLIIANDTRDLQYIFIKANR